MNLDLKKQIVYNGVEIPFTIITKKEMHMYKGLKDLNYGGGGFANGS